MCDSFNWLLKVSRGKNCFCFFFFVVWIKVSNGRWGDKESDRFG